MSDSTALRHGRLILVPALITLGVTLLRLTGELQQWSSALFNRSAGGGGAIVGIVWLVPVFGVCFALRVAREGNRPDKIGRALGLVFLALVLQPIPGLAATALGNNPSGTLLLVFAVVPLGAVLLAFKAWPELGRVLAVYSLAARLPVAIVMLIAILANWGTHYDVTPPGFPEMAPLAKWFWIGLVPQMTSWVSFTVTVGMLFGLTVVAISYRGRKRQAV